MFRVNKEIRIWLFTNYARKEAKGYVRKPPRVKHECDGRTSGCDWREVGEWRNGGGDRRERWGATK